MERSDWKGQVTSPKGGRLRYVPMTRRLGAARRDHRHLKGPRVLCQADGRPLTQKVLNALSPAATVQAIQLLDAGQSGGKCGDILETGRAER